MAILEDEQRNILVGIAVGLGVAALIKEVAPAFKGAGRPLAKAAIKSGIIALDKSREAAAHVRETYEDLVAEVRSEMEEEARARAAVPGPMAPPQPEPEGGA
jgi:hypothetical protein